MNAVSEIKQLWTCPNCGRQFERQRQAHSCKPFALEQHFKRKETGKLLYEALKKALEKQKEALKKQIGAFKIESLECCIHFVSTFTFAAVKIFKNKIQVDFALNRSIESERFHQSVQMSAHRYLYYVDITNEEEIDDELMQWIQEAHDKN